MKTRVALVTGLALLLSAPIAAAGPLVAGFPPERALELGERMYRTGLLPSGEPMQALVQDDIPVDGTMFSCESCHLRSGLGTAEGTIITLPTNGGKLYKPLHRGAEIELRPSREQLAKPFQSKDIRPAYTEESLKQALRNGVAPDGRELSATMPRYQLEPGDMEILVHYLNQLSTDFSPGVDATTLSLATVVTDEVAPAEREAFLGALQAYVNDRNAQSRGEERRSRLGPFFHQDMYTTYRRLELQIWTLHGPPSGWPAQLRAHYREKPVFALIGGLSRQEWGPIHRFCEEQQLPCILPLTRLPQIDGNGWYTLYFSKGFYQEGEAAARFLRPPRGAKAPAIVQVVVEQPAALAAARGFAETWRGFDQPTPPTVAIAAGTPPAPGGWRQLAERYPDATLLLWVSPRELAGIEELAGGAHPAPPLVLSGTLLENRYATVPEELRANSLLTYPYRLPVDMQSRMRFVDNWLRVRKVPATEPELQSQVYFLSWLMSGALHMMGDDFYRDYFLDVIDMMNDEVYASAHYPRLSFGPGQRFASKGCYLVRLGTGAQPELTPQSPWVIH